MVGSQYWKIGSGSAKRYVESRCVVSEIDEQGDDIGKIGNTLQSASKWIKVMSTTMVGMGKNLHNIYKEIEFYANKLHRADQQIEVSSFYILLLYWKNGKHTSYHYCYAYIYFSFVGIVKITIHIIIIIFFLFLEA